MKHLQNIMCFKYAYVHHSERMNPSKRNTKELYNIYKTCFPLSVYINKHKKFQISFCNFADSK